MYHAQHISADGSRRGVILMVVLALLTLFAIVGVSFVYYADAEAKSAQINREAENTGMELDPELLASYFLGQMVYDVDNQNGVFSSLRGQSLARSIYGANDNAGSVNYLPFCGTGRLHSTTSPLGGGRR